MSNDGEPNADSDGETAENRLYDQRRDRMLKEGLRASQSFDETVRTNYTFQ